MDEQRYSKEFLGLLMQLNGMDIVTTAKLLGASLRNEDGSHKEGEEIVLEIMNKFEELNRRDRKDMIRILRATVKNYDKKDKS